MVDEVRTQPVTAEHCPWCSAEIAPALPNCPACGAALMGDSDASLPGVTSLDPEAISRAARSATPQRRSRLLSWISGDYDDVDKPAAPGSLSPPPPEVRREMLRLALEAEVASLQAQTEALVAEADVEAREEAAIAPVGVGASDADRAAGSAGDDTAAGGDAADAGDDGDGSD